MQRALTWRPFILVCGFGKPDDIARAVLDLLDLANDFVIGTSLAVDDGFLAQ
jgi:hypothetical protein